MDIIFGKYKFSDNKSLISTYQNKWEGYIDSKTHDKGIYYVFTKCPIRDFCKKMII